MTLARCGLILCALALVALTGCASGPPPAVPPGPGQTLGRDEGFVVVQVDTDLAIERIEANGRPIAFGLQPGQHLWIVRMKAGRQRWTAIKFRIQADNDGPIRPKARSALNEQEFGFDVESGAVNYPGEIMIRLRAPKSGANLGVDVRNRNHSAMAIRKLRASHEALLDAHPIRYAGSSGDEFLQFYSRERARTKRSPGADRAAMKDPR